MATLHTRFSKVERKLTSVVHAQHKQGDKIAHLSTRVSRLDSARKALGLPAMRTNPDLRNNPLFSDYHWPYRVISVDRVHDTGHNTEEEAMRVAQTGARRRRVKYVVQEWSGIGDRYTPIFQYPANEPGRRLARPSSRRNPADFERCVRDVTVSSKKRGYPLRSAYAVCAAAMRRKNPSNREKLVVHLYRQAQSLKKAGGPEYAAALVRLREEMALLMAQRRGRSIGEGEHAMAHAARKAVRKNSSGDYDRPRRIVRIAAAEKGSASEWLRRDERGIWEQEAKKLWDETSARRAALGMSDDAAEEQIALLLRMMALKTLVADAKKRAGSRSNPSHGYTIVEVPQKDVMAFMDGRMSLHDLRYKTLGKPVKTAKRPTVKRTKKSTKRPKRAAASKRTKRTKKPKRNWV